MVQKYSEPPIATCTSNSAVQVIRHAKVCEKLQISSAKLFDMVARGQFPKPFSIVPGGRAVGWLESDVDCYVLDRKMASIGEAQ
jgi:prophage regulatory protein